MKSNQHGLFSLGFAGLNFCLQSEGEQPEVCSLVCFAGRRLAS